MPSLCPDSLEWLRDEIARQDYVMGGGYARDRDGVRMAISSLEDEIDELKREIKKIKKAWRAERSGGPQPHDVCGPMCDRSHAWRQTRAEALQVAAIAFRLVRDLKEDR